MEKLDQIIHDIRNHVGNALGALARIAHIANEDKEMYDIAKCSLTKVDPYLERLECRPETVVGLMSIFVVLSEIRDRITKGLPFNTSFSMDNKHCSQDVLVHCHQDALNQLIDNILDNALKARANKIVVTAIPKDCYVQIHFKDNGCGMSPEDLEKLGFGHTTTGSGKGAEIIRTIVTTIGGCVYWTSIEDIGSSCIVKFKRQRKGDQNEKQTSA